MTTGWVTNEDIAIIGDRLGQRLLWMLDILNQAPMIDVPTHHPKGSRTGIVDSIVTDALDFTTLDPQKITDEYMRLQQAARDTINSLGDVETHHSRFADNWRGKAADAFAAQLTNIKNFVGFQQDHILGAVAVLGTAFSLSVRIRGTYYNFAETMIAVCDRIAGKVAEEYGGFNEVILKLGVDIVDKTLGLIDSKGRRELLKWGVEQVLDFTKDKMESDDPMDTHAADAQAAIDTYIRGRDQLRASFESGLVRLRTTIDQQTVSLANETVKLFEPLPADQTDLSGPNFKYEEFFYEDDGPGAHSPEVEQERKKYLEAKPTPQTPIERKLAGME